MQYSKIELSFDLDITIGTDLTLTLSAGIIPGSGFLMFRITPDPNNPPTIDQVFELMAGNNWSDLIPGPLQFALDEIVFQGFLATVYYNLQKPSFELSSIAVSIGSNPNRKIPLFGPFKEFIYRFIWTVLNPTNEATRSSVANFFAEVPVELTPSSTGTIEVEIIT
ncbi:hypothetical protein [Mucilaginibacter sp.]|mgnify:CR=1 FL=1|jgi:hypothetical protein|uniref:hypothetical protein n=1 Tax=Mucilaginibacter sp. TaxID=1882438 RepID=UPI002C593262|nr:hypothetical protein [Mucilaginibacter sp.]HTI60212.1 hypothetical protein [Mucilaginibacter sp.]